MYNAINEIELENQENAILLEDNYNAKVNRTLKLYIPKIMSLGNKGTEKRILMINRYRLLANDNIESTPTNVTVCNYIEVPIMDSAFRGPHREDKWGRIHLYTGEKIICIVPNGNIKNIQATDWGSY